MGLILVRYMEHLVHIWPIYEQLQGDNSAYGILEHLIDTHRATKIEVEK